MAMKAIGNPVDRIRRCRARHAWARSDGKHTNRHLRLGQAARDGLHPRAHAATAARLERRKLRGCKKQLALAHASRLRASPPPLSIGSGVHLAGGHRSPLLGGLLPSIARREWLQHFDRLYQRASTLSARRRLLDSVKPPSHSTHFPFSPRGSRRRTSIWSGEALLLRQASGCQHTARRSQRPARRGLARRASITRSAAAASATTAASSSSLRARTLSKSAAVGAGSVMSAVKDLTR